MTSVNALDDVLRTAVRVRVTEGGTLAGEVRGWNVLLEADDPAALRQLRQALAVERVTGGLCMCLGDLALEFFDPAGQRLALVGLHHAVTIRWSGWDSDAQLRDGDEVLQWLAERGAAGPLAREQERQREREAAARAREEWFTAAPMTVRHYADAAIRNGGIIPAAWSREVAQRLEFAFPDPVKRATTLLVWYASGSGLCSGFPAYEDLPQEALANLPITAIIEALQSSPDDDRVTAGAVRHLFSWKSRTAQQQDIAQLPADLRTRLLASARASGNDDKQRRAENWLSKA